MSSSERQVGGQDAEQQQQQQQQCELVDITSLVEKAASSLTHQDPLLFDAATFSLQESMSALEVTDSKMDCCELPVFGGDGGDGGGKTVPPRRLPTGLHHPLVSSTLPWDALTLSDARTIALEALTRLYAVLDGAGAAESTYSFLYAHDGVLADMATALLEIAAGSGADAAASSSRKAAKHAVYASALLLVKLNDSIRTIAMNADIYEEEDFTLNTQGFLFAPRVDLVGMSNAVSSAIDALRKIPNNATDKDDAKVLVLVLQFQLALFDICANMSTLKAESVRSTAEDVKSDLLVKCLKRGRELLTLMQASAINSTPDGNDGVRSKRIIDSAFDPYLCRALMGNTPVRKIRFKTPVDALSGLIDIVAEMDWTVFDLLLKGSSIGRIRRMLEHVSKSSVNILNRSLIVLNLYFDDLILGQHDISVLVIEHMHQLGGVPATITDTKHCKAFAVRLGKPIYDTLKLLALNRNRRHAYMDVLVIKEWPLLQQDAVSLDYHFHQELDLGEMDQTSAYLTNYTSALTTSIMAHYASLQVELGLLRNHHDLAIAFWYRAFLLSAQLNATTLLRKAKVQQKILAARAAALEEEARRASSETKNTGGSNGRSKKKGKKGSPNTKRTQASAKMDPLKESKEDMEDGVELMLNNLKRSLCRGTVQFIAALDQAGLVKTPSYEFTSQRKRFSKRYEAFSTISTPPPLAYDDFEQGYSHADVRQQTLIASAMDCFKASKTVVDKLLSNVGDGDDCYLPILGAELRNLAKVCIGNSLFLHKFSRQVQSGDKVEGEVSFDFEAHRAFCIVKLA